MQNDETSSAENLVGEKHLAARSPSTRSRPRFKGRLTDFVIGLVTGVIVAFVADALKERLLGPARVQIVEASSNSAVKAGIEGLPAFATSTEFERKLPGTSGFLGIGGSNPIWIYRVHLANITSVELSEVELTIAVPSGSVVYVGGHPWIKSMDGTDLPDDGLAPTHGPKGDTIHMLGSKLPPMYVWSIALGVQREERPVLADIQVEATTEHGAFQSIASRDMNRARFGK